MKNAISVLVEGEEFIIGQEYEFSDMLQKDKGFKVEWKKGVLIGYLPVNGTSCAFHFNNGGISYHIRHIKPQNEVIDLIDLLLMTKHSYDKEDLKEIKKLLK